MFHEHVFFVCQKYKSLYYAEIWRLPNSRQNDDQNVQLLEQRHDQQCRKIVKKTWIPHIRLRSQRGTRATKKTSKSIVLAQDLVRKFDSKKKHKNNKKTLFFKRQLRAPHKKNRKNRACCPKIKQVHRYAKRAQSNFFVKKTAKNVFFKRQLRAPHENSRKFGKIGGFDNCQSQKKSVISWFFDSVTEILLGKRKVVRCCSFLLRCS